MIAGVHRGTGTQARESSPEGRRGTRTWPRSRNGLPYAAPRREKATTPGVVPGDRTAGRAGRAGDEMAGQRITGRQTSPETSLSGREAGAGSSTPAPYRSSLPARAGARRRKWADRPDGVARARSRSEDRRMAISKTRMFAWAASFQWRPLQAALLAEPGLTALVDERRRNLLHPCCSVNPKRRRLRSQDSVKTLQALHPARRPRRSAKSAGDHRAPDHVAQALPGTLNRGGGRTRTADA
jgi:hypothetical protein